ncbi:heavy metal translocating P-type ATPase [Helicobacter zhangjianzhongii]|uniref:Heavy metal translocating P-type ATPase n=1 Tax=Helicobacter zhangjianzhongii TaxID=2974574 RepID=A0ACC6FTX8_9HELI|nr:MULTISPECIES: heavy metal translocating P-type ATPase [unclassified Helicobacter]MDL0080608.1 heavy metal translocating P-type ATPase [Helicobacter sp. CPD2-1]MDL0082547.1 heavy metal translocating P-type ATPase [Helicobacter sp. XJK30-2]
MQQFHLDNLDCPNCAAKLESTLRKSQGIAHAQINFTTSTLLTDCANMQKLQDIIAQVEPQVRISRQEDRQPKRKIWTKELALLLGLIIIFLSSLALEYLLQTRAESLSSALSLLHIALYVIAGKEVFKRAYANAKRKEFFDENVLMIVASIAAFIIGASEEAVGIMLFFSVGEYLQNASLRKGMDSINALANLTPPQAHKIHNGKTIDIAAKDLVVGDEIIVLAGEVVPVDCVLLDEIASFDTSAISGESLPLTITQNTQILAGSITLSSPATMRAIRPYATSQIAKITELIENATAKKAKTESFITSFARYYTPIVFFAALCIALVPPLFASGGYSANLYDWVYRAIVVLMVSCPCALVISVPLGYFGGIVASSKVGVLLKGSSYLEALSQLSMLGFDKTGTLTEGSFKVVDIVPENGVSKERILGFAACAQDLSTHPIAQSIKQAYMDLAHTHHISEFEEFSGLGVRAVCDHREIIAGNDKILHKFSIPHNHCDIDGTIVHISVDKDYLGYIIIADTLKVESKRVIDELKQLHITPIMLSGDGEYPCKIVGEQLGIAYHSQLLPQDKAAYFEKLKAEQKGKVGFVGDGINDAPTLALADVGIAMGGGSDLSRQKADMIVLNNSLDSLLQAIKIAKKTKIIIYENIIMALGIKGLFIILGILGVASIWEAVFGDVGVALLALANAMRTMKGSHIKRSQSTIESKSH